MSQKKPAARKPKEPKETTEATEPIEANTNVKAAKADRNNLRIYLNRLLKLVKPDIPVRNQAIDSLNSLAMGLIQRILDCAVTTARLHTPTVKSVPLKSVRSAVYSMLPVVVRDSIVSVADEALEKYKASLLAEKDSAKDKKKSRSKSDRSGLVLSVSRVDKIMRASIKQIGFRASQLISVYIAAVVENLVKLALPLAIEALKALKRESVNEQAIIAAVESSPVLVSLFIDWLLVTKQEQEQKKSERNKEKKEKKEKAPSEKTEKKSRKTKTKAVTATDAPAESVVSEVKATA